MGGRSKSRQKTTTTQRSTNAVYEGDYAGVSGNVNHDESDSSINDSYNTEDSYNTDIDNSVEDSYNTDIDDSFNTTTNNDIDIDNSQDWDIDESQRYEDAFNTTTNNDIDNSVSDAFNTTTNNDIDNSQQWEVDNSLSDSNNTDNSQRWEDAFNTTNDINNSQQWEVDNSLSDSNNTDNSQQWEVDESVSDAFNTTTNNDIDNSLSDSNNTDNSKQWEDAFNTTTNNDIDNSQQWEVDESQSYEDAFNTTNNIDNSQRADGDFGLNRGTINITDGGAFELAQGIASQQSDIALAALNRGDAAIEYGSQLAQGAFDASNDNLSESLGFASGLLGEFTEASASTNRDSLSAMQQANRDALEFGGESLSAMQQANRDALEFGGESLSAMQQANRDALEFGGGSLDSAFDFGGAAIDELSSNSQGAINSISELSQNTNELVTGFGGDVIAALAEQNKAGMERFTDELKTVAQTQLSTNSNLLKGVTAQNSKDKEVIASLARSTALQGQDVVAENSAKMVKYFSYSAVALALGLAIYQGVSSAKN